MAKSANKSWVVVSVYRILVKEWAVETRSGWERRAGWLTTIAGALLLCAVSAGAASAQTTAIANGAPSDITLGVPVTASVASACGFASGAAPSEAFAIPTDLNNAFTHDVGFTLQCTVASRIAVVSAHGGLLTPMPAPSGYTALRNYNVALHVVGDAGVIPADGSCAVATLKSTDATCAFYGAASPSVGLGLSGSSYNQGGSYLRLSSAAYAASATLVASNNYSDTLTVTLSAAP